MKELIEEAELMLDTIRNGSPAHARAAARRLEEIAREIYEKQTSHS